MCRPKWPFLHRYGSHDVRHVEFRGLTGSQQTPRVWGVTIGLHRKEIGALVNINLLDTRNNSIGQALLASAEVNMNQNYAVICCIPQFCIDLREFTEKIKITINTKGYDVAPRPERVCST